MMYAVTVAEWGSNDVTVYGPYRTLAKACEVRDLFHNPHAVEYYDDEEYAVDIATLRRYGE